MSNNTPEFCFSCGNSLDAIRITGSNYQHLFVCNECKTLFTSRKSLYEMNGKTLIQTSLYKVEVSEKKDKYFISDIQENPK